MLVRPCKGQTVAILKIAWFDHHSLPENAKSDHDLVLEKTGTRKFGGSVGRCEFMQTNLDKLVSIFF